MIMKNKFYTVLGFMSGTSMDGIDVSLIKTDGINQYINVLDEYYKFDEKLFRKLLNLRGLVYNKDDLIKYSNDLNELDREITIFHSEIVNNIIQRYKNQIDLIGFHGQTIFHNANQKVSRQIGDGRLLSQLTKKKVVYDFRQEDMANGGQGAPLTPIFHNLISKVINTKSNVKFPIGILNIGGISNISVIDQDKKFKDRLRAFDIGPGNCLIDQWVQKNSQFKFDDKGTIGKSGIVDKLILNQAIENFRINSYDKSLDINDFDISFAKGLTLENGCATVTSFTAYLITKGIEYANNFNKEVQAKYLVCGGGRKNDLLIEAIKFNLSDYKNITIDIIDKFNFDGDFIESQAFGYLAVRSFLKLPISFPNTTGCKTPTVGGKIVSNY